MNTYTLEDNKPVASHRFVGSKVLVQDMIKGHLVSTVFLGYDASCGVSGEPLVFETMVFKDTYEDLYCRRCSTYDDAMIQHETAKTLFWEKTNDND
jgi:hypothetical protein